MTGPYDAIGRILTGSGVKGKTHRSSATFEDGIDSIYFGILRPLLIERHRKYGPKNHLRFRQRGLIVRINDKLSRLEHAFFDGHPCTDRDEENDWADISNLAIIGLMQMQGVWERPLSED